MRRLIRICTVYKKKKKKKKKKKRSSRAERVNYLNLFVKISTKNLCLWFVSFRSFFLIHKPTFFFYCKRFLSAHANNENSAYCLFAHPLERRFSLGVQCLF